MEYDKPSALVEQIALTIIEAIEDGVDVNVFYIQKSILELLLDSNFKLVVRENK